MTPLNQLEIKHVSDKTMPILKVGNAPMRLALVWAFERALEEMREDGDLPSGVHHQILGRLFVRGKLEDHYTAIINETERQNP